MKTNLQRWFVPMVLVFTLISCSPNSDEPKPQLITEYDYSQDELKLAQVINEYRESQGLNPLEIINHISYKSMEHNQYMIENNVISHANFEQRSSNIIQVLGAVKVGENLAYNFSTANSVLYAWLQSPGHKANLDSNYTHFGISITINPENGKKYYTNIFMRR